jgi:glycine/sarcosine/betaine reductase complex component A
VAERYSREELMVLIGTPNPESSELVATTLMEGDPTWAGVLAGVRLELPVFHITEEGIKELVPPDVYASQVGLAEVALDTGAIAEAVQQVRTRVRTPD